MTFNFYKSYADLIESRESPEEREKCFEAIVNYGLHNIKPDSDFLYSLDAEAYSEWLKIKDRIDSER